MQNSPINFDLSKHLKNLEKRISVVENRRPGTIYLDKKIVTKDPVSGVETVIGDLSEYGEDRMGIKQFINDIEPPPIPTSPMVATSPGLFTVSWDGANRDGFPHAPDFDHLNVYGSDGSSTFLVGSLKNKEEVVIVPAKDYGIKWNFWFTSVDQNGNESVPSNQSLDVTSPALSDAPDIAGAISDVILKIEEESAKAMTAANGKNRIWSTPSQPVADPKVPFIEGDTWFDTDDGNKIYIWKTSPAPAGWKPAVLDSSALDAKVNNLINTAKNQSDTAIQTANGKNRAYHQTTAPTGTGHTVGDLWFDTANDNRLSKWDGSKWVVSAIGSKAISDVVINSISAAQNAATAAKQSADGKNTNYYATTAPTAPTGGFKVGDTWFDTANGNRINRWDGSKWVIITLGTTGLSSDVITSIANAKLAGDNAQQTANAVSQDLIDAEATFASEILATSNAAKSDAQAKADAAQAAAISAAAITAQLKADGAKSDAIAAAELKAQQLADAAKQAALDAAKADATAKADAAKQAAIVAAAGDAQIKADAVKVIADKAVADAQKARSEAISRGTDLVTNGTGLMGDNTNFPGFDFIRGDQPVGMSGSFTRRAGYGTFSTERMPIDTSKKYLASVWVRQSTPGVSSRFYLAIQCYDVDGLTITTSNYMEQAGTRTTLAADLKPGDTTVQLTSSANWKNNAGAGTHLRRIIFWNYVDGTGRLWGPGTYTRNTIADAYDDGGITGNTITLRVPYSGALVPAGTSVGNGSAGGNYPYPVGYASVTEEWVKYPGTFLMSGIHTDPLTAATSKFPNATASVTIGVLPDYSVSGGSSRQLFAGFSFSDVTANAQLVEAADAKAIAAQTAADNAQAKAQEALSAAGSAQGVADSALTMAGTKSNVFYSTLPASGTGVRVDDIWRQRDATNQVIGEWRWTGSIWQKITLTNGVFSNLDAGLITVGTLQADRIGARSITAEKIVAKSLTANEIKAGTLTSASGIFGTLDASIINAGTLNSARLNAGDIRAKFLEAGKITAADMVAGTITADSGIISSLNAGVISTGFLDSERLKAGSITTEHLVVADATNFATIDPQRGIDVMYPTNWATQNDGEWTTNKASSEPYLFLRDALGPIPFKSGDKFVLKFTGKATAATTGSIRAYFYPTKGSTSGAVISATQTVALTTDAKEFGPIEFTVPNISSFTGSGAWIIGFFGANARTISVKNVFLLKMVDATVIAPDSITTSHMQANSITAASGIIKDLDASRISTGTMHGKYIQANTLAAEALAIGSFDNLIPEPEFNNGGASWSLISGTSIIPTGSSTGGPALRITANSSHQSINSKTSYQVSGGESYKLTARFKSSATIPAGSVWIAVRARNRATGVETYPYVTNSTSIAANTWTTISDIIEVPDTTDRVVFFISARNTLTTGNLDVEFVSAVRATNTVLIKDGAISASKMELNSITATNGIIASLNASLINYGEMEGKYIKSKTISVDRLLVGSNDNVIPDPQFFNTNNDWGSVSAPYSFPQTEGRDGKAAMKISPNSSQSGRYSQRIPVTGGESYRVSAWVKSDIAIPKGSIGFYYNRTLPGSSATGGAVNFLKQSDGSVGNDAIAANTWTLLSAVATLPENIATVAFGFYVQPSFTTGTVWFSDAAAFRMGDGNLIVDGSITASAIDAGTITVDKLAIGTSDNMVVDPEFEDAKLMDARFKASSTPVVGPVKVSTLDGRRYVTLPVSTSQLSFKMLAKDSNRYTPVVPGAVYKIKYQANVTSGTAGTRPAVTRLKADGTTAYTAVNSSLFTTINSSSWSWVEYEWTAPSDAKAAFFDIQRQAGFTADLNVMTPSVTRMSSGELIVDGAIDGKIITGAILQTDSQISRGIKFSKSHGISAYNDTSGERTFYVDPVSGDVTMRGKFYSGSDTGVATFIDDTANGLGYSGMVMQVTPKRQAYIKVRSAFSQFLEPTGSLMLSSAPSVDDGGDEATFKLAPGAGSGSGVYLNDGMDHMLYMNQRNGLVMHSTLPGKPIDIRVMSKTNGDFTSGLELLGNFAKLYGRSSGSAFGPYMQDLTAGGISAGLKTSNGNGYFQVNNMWTTTSAANCYVNTSGTLYRSTSSRKNKLAIEDLSEDRDDLILSLRARTWFDRQQAEDMSHAVSDEVDGVVCENENLTELRRIPGMVAEEVEEVGLTEFVQYGTNGEVEGLMYDRLGVALIPIVARQRDRIVALENTLNDLNDRLQSIESRI